MKKYIISILVASVFLMGAPFAINSVSAQNLSIRDFINLLVAIGVITPEKMPAVNAYLATLDGADEALIFMNKIKKDFGFTQEIIKTNKNLTFKYGSNCLGNDNLNGYMIKGVSPDIKSYGFVTDSYNSADATFGSTLGTRKDSILCQYKITYIPENGDSKMCWDTANDNGPNLLKCPQRNEFFCTDLNQISKDKFKDSCQNNG